MTWPCWSHNTQSICFYSSNTTPEESWVCVSLFHISLRTWWSFWMLTAPSALSCCSSPPGASSQPVWHLTSTPCPGSFPACTSWHWMPHNTAGEWSYFLVLYITPPSVKVLSAWRDFPFSGSGSIFLSTTNKTFGLGTHPGLGTYFRWCSLSEQRKLKHG